MSRGKHSAARWRKHITIKMTEERIKFQVGLFGAFEEITPTPGTLKYFLDVFADLDLVPSVFQELNIPPGVTQLTFGVGGPERFSLSRSDGSLNIGFGLGRIDIKLVKPDMGSDLKVELEPFLELVNFIIHKINDKFPKKYHRITLISEYAREELEPNQLSSAFSKILIPVALYQENKPTEWQSRIVAQVTANFNGGEICNAISTVNRTIIALKTGDQIRMADGLIYNFDINTSHLNAEYRFGVESIAEFLNEAAGLEESLHSDYNGLLG